MDRYIFLVITVIIVIQQQYEFSEGSLNPGGLHVCSRRYTYNTYYTAPAQRIAYSNYRTCCKKVWGVCLRRCTRYRTRMVTYYVSKLRVNHGTSYYCCSGWARRGNECPVAICRPPCQNGYCTAPNRCHCRPGFAGKYCQIDINECLKSPCQQICKNLRGTYACSCRRGFTKVSSNPKDGRCQNINECTSSNKLCNCAVVRESCKATCIDTVGSYRCQCNSGYQLVQNKICKDIDECKAGGHDCQHRCINQLGGYKCTCNSGYWLRADKKSCYDVNECRRSNGGCEHTCANTLGSYMCSCRSGYILGYDKARCIDVNECLHKKPCDPMNGVCQNVPGSYRCICRTGYTLVEGNKCQDLNECIGANKCEQLCYNTVGSYYCGCRKGYELATDNNKCTDIDECMNSLHDCDQICINMVGTFRCNCRRGFRLQADKRTCQAVRCRALEKPLNGAIQCTGFTYSKRCTYTCNDGYHLIGNRERTCRISSRWTGNIAKCSPKPCPGIRPPLNGMLELPCIAEYKSVCTVKCKKGFILHGSEDIKCGIMNGNVMWIDNNATCKESKICQPNPCQNNGICRLRPALAYECDCSGTGFVGENCETGVVSMATFPPLVYGKSTDWIEIHGRPEKEIVITPQALNGDIIFIPKRIEIRSPLTKAKFKINPRSSGLVRIRYSLSGASAKRFSPIGDTLVFVASSEPSEKINKIPSVDFTLKQCHAMKLDECPNKQKIELVSSCPWKSSGTSGYQSVAFGKLKIPLSIGGIKFPVTGMSHWMYMRKGTLTVSKELNSVLKREPRFCSPGEVCKDGKYTSAEHQFLINQNLFARAHLKTLRNLIPKWMSVNTLYGYNGFHISNVQGMVLKGYNIRQLKICQNMPMRLSPAVYVAQLLFIPVTIRLHGLKETIESSSPTCVITDICRRKVYFSLPRDNNVNFAPQLKVINVRYLQLQVLGFGFGGDSSVKTECIKIDDISRECFHNDIWLKVSFSIKRTLVKVFAKGEISMASENLNSAAIDRFTKPLKYVYRGELKAFISVMAGGRLINFVIEEKNGFAYGAFGLPSSSQFRDKVYGLSLTTRSHVSTAQNTSVVSFHPESSKGEFKARIIYGLYGGKVIGIQNSGTALKLLRRMAISLPRIISLIQRSLRLSRSILKTEYESLSSFSRISKSLVGKIIKMLSSPRPKYDAVYNSLLSVLSLSRDGNDIADLMISRVSVLLKRESRKRSVLSQLKVLKRSLQIAMQLQVIPKTTIVTETYSGMMMEYSGKLCFQALCFSNLDVSIDNTEKKTATSNELFITAIFRENETISGHFTVLKGTKLEARVSKSREIFNVKVNVHTKVFGSAVSSILELDQDKARFVLPAFHVFTGFEFDIEVRAEISKTSNWQNIFFKITGSASRESDIAKHIEKTIGDYITTTSEIIKERRTNASSLVSGISRSVQKMKSEKIIKLKLFMNAELAYEKMKSLYATALTNLNISLISFRSYRVNKFFKKIEEDLDKLYPFLKCNDTCISVPIYCICQDAVTVDVNTLACQLADRKVTTTIEKPLQTQCPLTEYRFIPYYTGTCKRGKSARLSGALGAVGAGIGGLVGGPVGAVVGGIIGGLFGGLFSSCSETYEVYKEVINRQVDCTLRTFKPVTKQWKEAVCANVTKNVRSGYGNPSECDCDSSNNTCVIAQDPHCAQNNIRNIERRRIYVRQQMESAGKYNDSFDRLQDAQKKVNSIFPKLLITEKRYLGAKRDFDRIEAKIRQASLEEIFTNRSISNFEENFALELCLSRVAELPSPVVVKKVAFDTNPHSREDVLLKMDVERTDIRSFSEKAFVLNLGYINISLKNGAKRIAQEIFCHNKLRKRRSLGGVVVHPNRELFVQNSVSMPQNMTNADKACLVSNTIFAFLKQAFCHLSKKIKSVEEKRSRISQSINAINLKLSRSDNFELNEQDYVLNSLITQLEMDLKHYTVEKLYNDWTTDMEVITGATNLTKCLHFFDCMRESFRHLKDLPIIARDRVLDFRSSIEAIEAEFMNLTHLDSFEKLSKAVMKIENLAENVVTSSAFCSKVPQVKLNIPPKIEVLLGNSLYIKCMAQSDIKPIRYAWIFNNITMLSEDNETLFLKVSYNTQGRYKCVASNSIGKNSSEETLIVVRDKPRLSNEPMDFRYYSSIPKEVVAYFACNITSDPPASITWYYQPFESKMAVRMNHMKPVLNIDRPTISDAGFYQCVAQNPFGTVNSRKARLDILKSKFPSQQFSLSFNIPMGRSGTIERASLKKKVISDGKLSSHQNVNISYEFHTGRSVNVQISVTEKLSKINQKKDISEIEMLRQIMSSRRGLTTSITKIVNGVKKNRGRSVRDSLEKSMKLDFNGEICGPGYFMHENGFTCLQCRVGSFEKHGICHPCGIGTYQTRPGQTVCHPCDVSKVTKQLGSVNIHQCIRPELQNYDVIFALDSSSSIGRRNWVKVRSFIRKFIEEFVNKESNLRIGVITYSNFVTVRIPLKRYGKHEIKKKINTLPYYGGLTMTYLGIIRAGGEFQKNYVEGRKRLLFIMTDGQSTKIGGVSGFTLSRRAAFRIRNTGVQVISIGIGDKVDPAELQAIASFPKKENSIQYNNFDQLITASRRIAATSLKGQCTAKFKDIAVALEASKSINDRKWREVRKFLHEFLLKMSSSVNKVSLSTFDSVVHIKQPFQDISSSSVVNTTMSKIVRNEGKESADYMRIAEHLFNNLFTEKMGSLSPHKILIMITKESFDFELLNSIKRSYPEENITLLTVVMKMKSDDDDDGSNGSGGIMFDIQDESRFTMANLSRLIRRIEADTLSKAECKSVGTEQQNL